MTSKSLRQSIFSFDMDMDVEETPKNIKAGNLDTEYFLTPNIVKYCAKKSYDTIWHVAGAAPAPFGKMQYCGQFSSAPLKMRLSKPISYT